MKSAILPRLYPAAAARAELEAETGAPETPLDAAQSLFSGLIEQTINVFASDGERQRTQRDALLAFSRPRPQRRTALPYADCSGALDGRH